MAGVKKKVIKFHPEVATIPSINDDKSTTFNANNTNTEKYWLDVVEQLKVAGEIAKREQKKTKANKFSNNCKSSI